MSAASGAGRRRHARGLGLVRISEDVLHYLVALLLLVIAVVVFVHTAADFARSQRTFSERVTAAVNGVLFVIIVMEILRTVIAHFEEAGFQLKPFLIIGIISAVRHILTVGAQVSLGAENQGAQAYRRAQIDLGVNAAVVLALVIGLVLVRRSDEPRPDSDEPGPLSRSAD